MLATMLALVDCTKDGDTIYQINPDEEKPSTAPLVTVIYGPNGLGDRSYNDLIYKGVETAAKKYGLRTLQLSPETEEQGLAYLETMFQQMESATDTVRRLFVTPSPVYDAYIRKNNKRLEKNPNADLLYMETTTPLEGKGSTLYIDYYGAMYMSGCMMHYCAADLVTLVLANPYTQSVREAGEGFQAGFYDSPMCDNYNSLRLHVRYLSDEPVGGFTVADSTALRIFEEERHSVASFGTNYVTFVPICGGAFNTFWRMNEIELGSLFIMGIDKEYHTPRSHLSVVKHIDQAIDRYIRQWLSGEGMPKHQSLGLASGYTDVIRTFLDYSEQYWEETLDELNEEKLKEIHETALRKEEEYEKK